MFWGSASDNLQTNRKGFGPFFVTLCPQIYIKLKEDNDGRKFPLKYFAELMLFLRNW